MKRLLQREWSTDILEALPSIVFLGLWRSNVDLQLSGWIGSALAAMLLVAFRCFRLPFNPFMLGINVHLVIITPLIMATFYTGAHGISDALVAHSYRGVLITVFLVGLALTFLSERGFVGTEGLPKRIRWNYSLMLLGISAGAILWAFSYAGGDFVAVAIPMLGMFGLRRYLSARAVDTNQLTN